MTEFEVLGTDREIDASDPVGSAMAMMYVIAGAAALFVALPVGQQIAGWVQSNVAQLTGQNVGDADPGQSYGSPD
jgi:hypothetical protein